MPTAPLCDAVQSTRWRQGCASAARAYIIDRMRRHHAAFHTAFWLVAVCWLVASPGGDAVRAVLACRHAAMHMAPPGGQQGGNMPSGAPCFCGQMFGGFDQTLSVALPGPALPPVTAAAVIDLVRPSRISHLPSWLLPPETPPPIVA